MENPKKKMIIMSMMAVILAGGIFYLWNNFQFSAEKRAEPLIPVPSAPGGEGKCGIEGCHGLDVTCGPDVAQMCDMMYQAGDGCRRYAKCETVSGKCQLRQSPMFERCKSCVQKCEADNLNRPDKVMDCESRCVDF